MKEANLSDLDIARFWRYVHKTDTCWLWTSSTSGRTSRNNEPYGCFGIMIGEPGNRRQIQIRAHRISFYLAHGCWPQGLVLHSCDNPRCVNPDHLREGTHKENTEDMTQKNRHGGRFDQGHKGYRGNARITLEIANQIRSEYVPHKRGGQIASDTSIKGLARKYGLSKRTVQFIIRGKYWREAEDS